MKCWLYQLLLSGWKTLETVSLPAHSWLSTGIRSVNVFPEYFNITDCVYVCACLHNYRCAVPPKLSLEKGMGMTPGYNHRLRLRNMLPSVLSWRQLQLPGPTQPIVWGNVAPYGFVFFYPQVPFFFFSFWRRKKTNPTLFLSLCLCGALRVVAVRTSAFLRVSVWGRSEPFIQGCCWPADKRENDIQSSSGEASRISCAGIHISTHDYNG